jgi:hypothetical protein
MRRLAAEGLGTLAPAPVALRRDGLWVHLTAPVLGACAGVLGCRCVQEPGCCRAGTPPQEVCP